MGQCTEALLSYTPAQQKMERTGKAAPASDGGRDAAGAAGAGALWDEDCERLTMECITDTWSWRKDADLCK